MIAEIRRIFLLNDIAAYDPETAFVAGGADPTRLVAMNFAALTHCDRLFAYLPDGVYTVGTPMEIQRAVDVGKPVGVIGSQSLMLTGRPGVITVYEQGEGGMYPWKSIVDDLTASEMGNE
jgi:hypothetical protein